MSYIKNVSDSPTTLVDAASDFTAFLEILFEDVFPQYANRPLHIAGESFGGHYVPAYGSYISKLLVTRDLALKASTNYTSCLHTGSEKSQ